MGVAVVDLGAGTTDLCVWHDNAVRFVRGIPFGAADINSDIHQQGILEKHVEGLKTTFGVAMADLVSTDKLIGIPGRSPREKQEISLRNLAIIIENRLREIIGFVMEEIGDSGYAGRLKGGIVLTGGGSQLAGIDELFSEATGMEVRLALPDVCIADDSIALAQDPAHATVIGLLIKAFAEGSPARVLVSEGVRLPRPDTKQDTGHNRTSEPGPGDGPEKPPKKEKKSRRERDKDAEGEGTRKGSRIKNWFEGFLSESLDGDEDF
jgi:cell division protein FtsA